MSHVSTVWGKSTNLKVSHGRGAIVTTVDGVDYLDYSAGIGVVNTGHCHPKVVAAIQAQAEKFLHAQMNCYTHTLAEELADKLAEITPASIEKFFFTNSGAEATEAAVKLAKFATRKQNIIVFEGSFHGRTHMAMAMTTSKAVYRAGYAPLPGGVFVSTFPYFFQTGETEAAAVTRCLHDLELVLKRQTAPFETAAIVLEPELGEGGYIPCPKAFFEGVARIAKDNDILFVADEVQTGFGRTGKMFATEYYDVQPDILVMAKGLASGFPISAIGARADIMDKWVAGSHGGTYGGNPMGCAAALATIDVMLNDGVLANGAARGAQLSHGLSTLAETNPCIGDVRGHGAMIATEFVDANGEPDGARTSAVVAHCLNEGKLILLTCGTYGNVVRWIPPLVTTENEVGTALEAFAAALAATS